MIYGSKPKLTNLRVFGTRCYFYNKDINKTKWSPRGIEGIMVGYTDRVDGFRIWKPGSRTIQITKDVVFLEGKSLYAHAPIHEPDDEAYKQNAQDTITLSDDNNTSDEEPSLKNSEPNSIPTPPSEHNKMELRRRTQLKRPSRFEVQLNEPQIEEPKTYKQAMASKHAKEWLSAMRDEIDSIKAHGVWSLVEPPKDRRPLTCRWVYKIKTTAENKIDRFRSRLVVRGFNAVEGLDFQELFAPVARYDTLRLVLAICAAKYLRMRQFDIKTAFLYGDLEEEIFINQPEGFTDGTNKVCLLHKSLYGLKQAPRNFNKKLKEVLLSLNLTQSLADNCLYYRHEANNGLVILTVYVDDILVAASNDRLIDDLLQKVQKHFTITSSPVGQFLGMHISVDKEHNICLNQEKYVRSVLRRFEMQNCRPQHIPADAGIYALEAQPGEKVERPYRALIGSLMFLAITTRPDIAFCVGFLSRSLDNYTEAHWNAALKVLRYLQATPDLSIHYTGGGDPTLTETLELYTDADWATDPSVRRSVSGLLCKLNGGPILWASQQQKSVSLSSTESEYISATEGAKSALWLRSLFRELNIKITPTIYVDNSGALELIKNPKFHKRSKHIHTRFMFIRETFERNKSNTNTSKHQNNSEICSQKHQTEKSSKT